MTVVDMPVDRSFYMISESIPFNSNPNNETPIWYSASTRRSDLQIHPVFGEAKVRGHVPNKFT